MMLLKCTHHVDATWILSVMLGFNRVAGSGKQFFGRVQSLTYQHRRSSCGTRRLSTAITVMAASTSLTYAKPLVFGPSNGQQPTASVIFLHGLGDSGDGWADLAPQFSAALPHVRFIFPTAPRRPITLNWGMMMNGWYDIPSLEEINSKEDGEGLKESFRYVEELISGEVASGVPASRIVVGGFSQGGAVALMMLRSNTKLAGIIGLSTYVPLHKEGPACLSEVNKKTPVLMCHGDADQVVAYQYGCQSHSLLKELGADVEFLTYRGMGHSACPSELADIAKFLAKQLPASQ